MSEEEAFEQIAVLFFFGGVMEGLQCFGMYRVRRRCDACHRYMPLFPLRRTCPTCGVLQTGPQVCRGILAPRPGWVRVGY